MNNQLEPTISRTLRAVILWAVYAVAFFVPIFYLPITADPLFAKHLLTVLLAGIAFLAWIVRMLLLRRGAYVFGILPIALLFLGISLFLSALFSFDRAGSFFAPDPMGERFFSFAAFLIFAFLIASEFSKKEIVKVIAAMLGSSFLLGLHTLFRVLPIVDLPNVLSLHPAGVTLNSVGAALGAFFLLSWIPLLFWRQAAADEKSEFRFLRGILFAMGIVSGFAMLLINFRVGWIAMAATVVVILAFHFSREAARNHFLDIGARTSSPFKTSAALFFALSVFVLFSATSLHPAQIISSIRTETEVAPSFSATIAIDREVLNERPFFGSGPGMFAYNYLRFKSSAINQTPFWDARFLHGYSFLTTGLTTIGIIGILALLCFLSVLAFALYRKVVYPPSLDPFAWGFGALILFIGILWAIYPAHFVLTAILFLSLGSFFGMVTPHDEEGEKKQFWKRVIFRGAFHLERQGTAFAVSFAGVILFIAVFLSGYFAVRRYVSEVYVMRGIAAFTQGGNADTALIRLRKAAFVDPRNDRPLAIEAQVQLALMQQAVGKMVAKNTGAEADFRFRMNSAIDAANRATALNPYDSAHWIILGSIYEAVLPFVAGADSLAAKAYEEAAVREPKSPVPLTALGGMYLALADLTRLQAERGVISKTDAATAGRVALGRAKENLEKAVVLKSDYARAQFLFAQVFTREGNTNEAIRRGATAALIAPQDVGIAFYLGLLFYQGDAFADAEQQFSRAVDINPNYSNARYFLGLIYDRTGRSGEALKQFRQIAVLNPDHQEIKTIISNIEQGLPALATVAPPPPEKRTEPPVVEDTPRVRSKR